jgi:ribonucleotide reductase alpha subunit
MNTTRNLKTILDSTISIIGEKIALIKESRTKAAFNYDLYVKKGVKLTEDLAVSLTYNPLCTRVYDAYTSHYIEDERAILDHMVEVGEGVSVVEALKATSKILHAKTSRRFPYDMYSGFLLYISHSLDVLHRRLLSSKIGSTSSYTEFDPATFNLQVVKGKVDITETLRVLIQLHNGCYNEISNYPDSIAVQGKNLRSDSMNAQANNFLKIVEGAYLDDMVLDGEMLVLTTLLSDIVTQADNVLKMLNAVKYDQYPGQKDADKFSFKDTSERDVAAFLCINLPYNAVTILAETVSVKNSSDKSVETLFEIYERIAVGTLYASTGCYNKILLEKHKDVYGLKGYPFVYDYSPIFLNNDESIINHPEIIKPNNIAMIFKKYDKFGFYSRHPWTEEQLGRDFKDLLMSLKDTPQYALLVNLLASEYLVPSTPITYNLGVYRPNGEPLASSVSCFLTGPDDSSEGIGEMLKTTALYSANSGGVSNYLGALRAGGSPVGKGGVAPSVAVYLNPFTKMLSAVNQGNRRSASVIVSIPIHHLDAPTIMRMHEPKATLDSLHKMYAGLVMSDSFINTFLKGGKWLLTSPTFIHKKAKTSVEVAEYIEGEEFQTLLQNNMMPSEYDKVKNRTMDVHKFKRNYFNESVYDWDTMNFYYKALSILAEHNPDMFVKITGALPSEWKLVDSKEYMQDIANAMIVSGKVWLMFHDTVNAAYSLPDNIVCTNLCQEITNPLKIAGESLYGRPFRNKNLSSVCVLANVNLSRMAKLNSKISDVDNDTLLTPMLEYTAKAAFDMVNAVNVGNKYPILDDLVLALTHRVVGVTSLGFTDLLHETGIKYDSIESLKVRSDIAKRISAATKIKSKIAFSHMYYEHGDTIMPYGENYAYAPIGLFSERHRHIGVDDYNEPVKDGVIRTKVLNKVTENNLLREDPKRKSGVKEELTEAYRKLYADRFNTDFDPFVPDILPINPELRRGSYSELSKGGFEFNAAKTTSAPTAGSSLVVGGNPNEPPLGYFQTLSTSSLQNQKTEYYLLKKLTNLGYGITEEIINSVRLNHGSVQHIAPMLVDERYESYINASQREKLIAELNTVLAEFKTGFEINQYFLTAMTAAAQAYTDQSLSHFIFLENDEEGSELIKLIISAWGAKLKTLYYVMTKTSGKLDAGELAHAIEEEPEISEGAVCKMEEGCISCQ